MRLAELLSAAEARAFDVRQWNCASFALAAVEAVTGHKPSVKVLPCLAASAIVLAFHASCQPLHGQAISSWPAIRRALGLWSKQGARLSWGHAA